MAGRAKYSAKLETAPKRKTLKIRTRPYFGRVAAKLSVGYVREPGEGRWIARLETGRGESKSGFPYPVYEIHSIGAANDILPADNEMIFDFDQAKEQARAWLRSNGNAPAGIPRTVEDMVEIYRNEFKATKGVDWTRPQGILDKHLLPYFRGKKLSNLKRSDGADYINARRNAKAANGTIQREYGILMRILNLAVENDYLDKNRLKRKGKALPQETRRERVASIDELKRLVFGNEAIGKTKEETLKTVRRAAIVALNTGLREGKILSINRAWIEKRADGYWLNLPQPASNNKGTPKATPLNRMAYTALIDSDIAPIDGRCFSEIQGQAFSVAWRRICDRAKTVDLNFHDLRHTFVTALQNLRVDYELRQLLVGHKMKGMTQRYSHGEDGPDVRAEKREAVEKLETYWTGQREKSEAFIEAERVSA